MRIAFIGLGKLGLPIAEAMAEHIPVYGYDTSPRQSSKVRICHSLQESVTGCSLIFVAVPTPHHPAYDGSKPTSQLPPRNFDYQAIRDVLTELDPVLQADQTLVLISTVLPGTIRAEFSNLLSKAELIYNPFLIAMGTEVRDFLDPEMVIMGTATGELTSGLSRLQEFYKSLLNPQARFVSGTWEEAECIKIFYNTFISTKLGLVNMIQDVSERLGHTRVDRITQALSDSTYRILSPMYMKAGLGDGGPCHPRDNIALRWLSRELNLGYDFFGQLMEAREQQAMNMAKAIFACGTHVVMLGKSFKPGVPYTEGSFPMLLAHQLNSLGACVYFVDPKMNLDERPEAEDLRELSRHGRVVYFASFWEDWISAVEFPQGSTLFDPWRIRPALPSGVRYQSYGDSLLPMTVAQRETELHV